MSHSFLPPPPLPFCRAGWVSAMLPLVRLWFGAAYGFGRDCFRMFLRIVRFPLLSGLATWGRCCGLPPRLVVDRFFISLRRPRVLPGWRAGVALSLLALCPLPFALPRFCGSLPGLRWASLATLFKGRVASSASPFFLTPCLHLALVKFSSRALCVCILVRLSSKCQSGFSGGYRSSFFSVFTRQRLSPVPFPFSVRSVLLRPASFASAWAPQHYSFLSRLLTWPATATSFFPMPFVACPLVSALFHSSWSCAWRVMRFCLMLPTGLDSTASPPWPPWPTLLWRPLRFLHGAELGLSFSHSRPGFANSAPLLHLPSVCIAGLRVALSLPLSATAFLGPACQPLSPACVALRLFGCACLRSFFRHSRRCPPRLTRAGLLLASLTPPRPSNSAPLPSGVSPCLPFGCIFVLVPAQCYPFTYWARLLPLCNTFLFLSKLLVFFSLLFLVWVPFLFPFLPH